MVKTTTSSVNAGASAGSPDGLQVLVGDKDGRLSVWSPATGQKRWELNVKSAIRSVAWSHDGKSIAYGGDDPEVVLRDAETRKVLQKLPHKARVNCVAFSPDDTLLAAGDADGNARLWEVASGKCREEQAVVEHPRGVYSVAFSPDGTRLASGDGDQRIRVWELASGALLHTFGDQPEGYPGYGPSIAWSPDGKTIVSIPGFQPATPFICFWDLGTGKCRHTVRGHDPGIGGANPYWVTWSPAGRAIAFHQDGARCVHFLDASLTKPISPSQWWVQDRVR